jgi:hypothetical protein
MAGDLSRLAEEIGTALLDWARSSSSEESDVQWKRGGRTEILEGDPPRVRGVVVTSDDTLIFDVDRPELDLPIRVIARALKNASEHSNYIATYLRETEPGEGEQHGRKPRQHYTSIRLAATMYTSFRQLVQLLKGVEPTTDHPADEWQRNEGNFAQQMTHLMGESVQAQAREVDREQDEELGIESVTPETVMGFGLIDGEEEITGRSREHAFDIGARVLFAGDHERALREIRKYAMMGVTTDDPNKKSDYLDYIHEIAATTTGDVAPHGQHEGD